ncbi:hypothetical protein ACEYW6_36060 [Nostoc sp. UIC 10607]|uniref:hypothetical protein n=1 Tax=Nostoc sp. UIC 10607 TaxID=3045935 RepID=UPI00399F002D
MLSLPSACQSFRLLLYKVEWSQHGWKYEIFTLYDNITVLESELIGTGNLQPNTKSLSRNNLPSF